MNRLMRGGAALAALLLGHCGLTLLAVSLNGVWVALVPLLAICRS